MGKDYDSEQYEFGTSYDGRAKTSREEGAFPLKLVYASGVLMKEKAVGGLEEVKSFLVEDR